MWVRVLACGNRIVCVYGRTFRRCDSLSVRPRLCKLYDPSSAVSHFKSQRLQTCENDGEHILACSRRTTIDMLSSSSGLPTVDMADLARAKRERDAKLDRLLHPEKFVFHDARVRAQGSLSARTARPTDRTPRTPISWGVPLYNQSKPRKGEPPKEKLQAARSAREQRLLWDQARQGAIWDERESTWDGTTHKPTPARFLGIKPITKEPWARDAKVYAAKTGSFERVLNADAFGDGTVAQEEYNDESALDSINADGQQVGYRSTVTATGLKRNSSMGGQPLWDSSVRRYCPPALKGIAPITREPWCEDEKVYNRNTTRDTSLDERAGGGAFDLGSISHRTRAAARQVDRSGFYMPNHERWAAALSA